MRKSIVAVSAAVLCSGLALTGAQASDASMSQCRDLAQRVRTALDNNQQSANYYDANRAQRSGQDFCAHGFYKTGIANYETALKLLGASEATSATSAAGA